VNEARERERGDTGTITKTKKKIKNERLYKETYINRRTSADRAHQRHLN